MEGEERKKERKEGRADAGPAMGRSINQALSMGYGIYREQPNAMAINQGLECQLYQYPSCTVMFSHKETHTPQNNTRTFLCFHAKSAVRVECRGSSLTLISFLRLKLGRTQ